MLANEQVRRVGRRKEQKKTNECQRGAVSSARSEEESTQLRPHSTRPPSDIHPSLKALTLCCCCCSVCFIRRYSPHCRMTLVRYRRRPLSAPNPPFWLSTIAKGSRRRNKNIRRIKREELARRCNSTVYLNASPPPHSSSLSKKKKKNTLVLPPNSPTNDTFRFVSAVDSPPLLFFSF